MNYQDYYLNQVSGGIPGFEGLAFQRGYGVGSIFKKFFKWIVPIIKDNALPILNKTFENVKDETISGITKFTNDVINDEKSIKESAKERFHESFSNLKRKFQKGSGKICKKKVKKLKNIKHSTCIFD